MLSTTKMKTALEGLNILVVGDVMIDSYMWGNVTRISPEAPVPIVSVTRREKRLGGAANVALNIRSMGAQPIICSVLGHDDHAKDFMHIMYDHDMDKRGIIESDDRRTTVKTRVIGNNMHIVRVDEETTRPICPADEETLIDRFDRILKTKKIDAIVLQDYDKGCLTPKVIDHVTTVAKRKGIITTVDPKHRNFALFHDVTLFKPNLKELKEGLNIEIDENSNEQMIADLKQAACTLHERQQIDIVMITLSNKGMFSCDFRQGEPQCILLPAQVRAVADVSGAGDTVIAVTSMALAIGLDLKEVMRLANLAGGIVCEQVGVVPVDRERLLSAATSIEY